MNLSIFEGSTDSSFINSYYQFLFLLLLLFRYNFYIVVVSLRVCLDGGFRRGREGRV